MAETIPLREQIFDLLNRTTMSIAQLTKHFGVTRNAVVVHLQNLEASGLIRRLSAERAGKVGKPTTLYTAEPGNEDQNSRAYHSFAEMQAKGLSSILNDKERRAFYKKIGKQGSDSLVVRDDLDFAERLQLAQGYADDLGAATTIEETDDAFVLQSYTCPIASIVRIEPCACHTLAEIFTKLTGHRTKQACQHGEKLICRFEIAK